MIVVYALKSLRYDYIYVGMTKNLAVRIAEHNSGKTSSNRYYAPFRLIYQESHSTYKEARVRERYFKSAAGKRKLRKMLEEEE